MDDVSDGDARRLAERPRAGGAGRLGTSGDETARLVLPLLIVRQPRDASRRVTLTALRPVGGER